MLPGGDPDSIARWPMDPPASSSGNLSPRAGSEAGEDMMQDFVKCHMMSILQPFAEHSHQLQTQVNQLSGELLHVREIADRHESSMEDHRKQLSSLQDAAAQACEGLQAAQAELSSAKRERNRLEGNHEMTKASIGKARERIEAVSSSAVALQETLQSSCERISKLESALPDTEKRIADEMESRLNRQGSACKDLVKQQAEVMKACEQAKTLGEKATLALKKLSSDHESQKHQDGGSLASLQELAANLDAKLAAVDKEVQQHTDKAKVADREMQHLKTWTKQLEDIGKLHDKHSETGALLDRQVSRIEQIEVDMAHMSEDATSQRQLQNSEFNNLEKLLSKSVEDTARSVETQRAHADLISSTGKRLMIVETEQSKFASFADVTEMGLRSLESWQQTAAKDLEVHALALETGRIGLSKTDECVQGTVESLQGVKEKLSTEHELLAKLGTRVDQCYKYFNGFGKGLQETQRQILSGDSSLLPPKIGGGSAMLPTLPTMPKTPRTPRGGLPAPRRQSIPKPGA